METTQSAAKRWSMPHLAVFRFFFSYFTLYLLGYNFFNGIPVLGDITGFFNNLLTYGVEAFNRHILHYKAELVPFNGSGDTSFGWAQLAFFLALSLLITLVWTIADRKHQNYPNLDYYLRTALRYFIATTAFFYGIIKVFAMQMTFPTLSQLATPLGDFLPMRFSWMFIGYSDSYQIFSGVMEVLVALFLLYRRTVTLGLLLGFGVFLNVLMLNLCYDVPVKIFSAHLTLMCLYLLIRDAKRILDFFVFNRPATQNLGYNFSAVTRGRRIFRAVTKTVLLLNLAFAFYQIYSQNEMISNPYHVPGIKYGMYEVKTFVKNGDTIPVLANDSIVWKDLIFETEYGFVSVNSTDTLFTQTYRRGTFSYQTDTIKKEMTCYKYVKGDSIFLFRMQYDQTDPKNIRLNTNIGSDSLKLTIAKSNRKFQLAERQFHWLSESNR